MDVPWPRLTRGVNLMGGLHANSRWTAQVIAIAGNKCDLEDKREVEKELAQGCTSCPLVRY